MIIAYYGPGKGKTTAALGVCLRALGRGLKVAVLQFIKGDPQSGAGVSEGAVAWTTGERLINDKLQIPNNKFMIKAVGEGFYKIMGDKLPPERHMAAAQAGLREAQDMIAGRAYQLVVLDEVLRALDEGLVTQADILKLIKLARTHDIHLILTGHRLASDLLEQCDLVTEMRKVRHPFDQGILAQEGIDY